jgi:hypothetical protein
MYPTTPAAIISQYPLLSLWFRLFHQHLGDFGSYTVINTRQCFHVPVITVASLLHRFTLDSFHAPLPQIQRGGAVRFAVFAHSSHGVDWFGIVGLQ